MFESKLNIDYIAMRWKFYKRMAQGRPFDQPTTQPTNRQTDGPTDQVIGMSQFQQWDEQNLSIN